MASKGNVESEKKPRKGTLSRKTFLARLIQGNVKRGRGRPKVEVDEEMLLTLATLGCTVPEIALALNVSKRTLETRFMPLLERGRALMRISLRHLQFQQAEQHERMTRFLGIHHLDQIPKKEIYHGVTPEQQHAFALQIGEIVNACFGPLAKANPEAAAALAAFCETMDKLDKAPEAGNEGAEGTVH